MKNGTVYLGLIITSLLTWPLLANELSSDGHFTIETPPELTSQQAEDFYRELLPQMKSALSLSEHNEYAEYTDWRRFNKFPYLSLQHGNRFLNNYGNDIAKDYLALAAGEKMPIGSILAKDSFTVTLDNEIFPGAFFIMEKLSEGLSPGTADWRYLMILPDSSVLGDSTGVNAASMDFCHACHTNVSEQDYVFKIPKDAL